MYHDSIVKTVFFSRVLYTLAEVILLSLIAYFHQVMRKRIIRMKHEIICDQCYLRKRKWEVLCWLSSLYFYLHFLKIFESLIKNVLVYHVIANNWLPDRELSLLSRRCTTISSLYLRWSLLIDVVLVNLRNQVKQASIVLEYWRIFLW